MEMRKEGLSAQTVLSTADPGNDIEERRMKVNISPSHQYQHDRDPAPPSSPQHLNGKL